MAYGDSYSAVQSASLAEKQMSNGIVNTLIGVLQNRKQLAQQDQQFQQSHALALMQNRQAQARLDEQRDLDEKKLQAQAAVLDFSKAQQASHEKAVAQDFVLRQQSGNTAAARETEIAAANRLKEKAFNFDSGQARTQNDRAAIADYESGMERYNFANDYAKTLNEKARLQELKKSIVGRHHWYGNEAVTGSTEPGGKAKVVTADEVQKAIDSLDTHITNFQATKRANEMAVYNLDKGKYVPIVRPPAEPEALRFGGTDTESGNIDSGVGFNPLLRGAAPPEASGSPVSDPATAQAPAQGDPRIAIYTQLVSSGMPDREAISEADRRYKAMLNQARYGGPSGF